MKALSKSLKKHLLKESKNGESTATLFAQSSLFATSLFLKQTAFYSNHDPEGLKTALIYQISALLLSYSKKLGRIEFLRRTRGFKIDPRHRYGHNLHFYYDIWSESKSPQPFFYWLDAGDGKELDLVKCSRNNLQRQCISYLGPTEREAYEVIVENGRLIYKQTGVPLNTVEDSKWLYVLSASKALYVGQKKKGLFHHSSFLSGGATTATGRLEARQGVLEAIWPYSFPTEESFKEFIAFLEDHNVDLTNVKTFPIDDDEDDDENLMETKQEDTKVANGSIQGESIHEQGSDAGNAKAPTFKAPVQSLHHDVA